MLIAGQRGAAQLYCIGPRYDLGCLGDSKREKVHERGESKIGRNICTCLEISYHILHRRYFSLKHHVGRPNATSGFV
jgi:hypothetical protein